LLLFRVVVVGGVVDVVFLPVKQRTTNSATKDSTGQDKIFKIFF
jgi:hypothetical protein